MTPASRTSSSAATLGTVLVTGGAGFIGCELSRALAPAAGHWVVLDNMHPQVHATPGTRPARLAEQAELVVGDVTDPEAWDALLDRVRPDVVFHLAAETGTAQSLTESTRHASVNVVGTTQMVDAFTRAAHDPSHILLTSSRAVYGEGLWRRADGQAFYPPPRTRAQLESGQWEIEGAEHVPNAVAVSLPAPVSVYGATKLAQEHVLSAWVAARATALSVLRLQNVYGPGQSLTNPYTGIVPLFSRLARGNRAIPLYEDGEITRDFVFIDDVVSAIVSAAGRPPVDGPRTVDVGTGTRTTIRDLAEAVAAMHAAPAPEVTGQFRDGDVRHANCDVEATTAALGWRPTWGLDDGVRALQDWMDEQTTAAGSSMSAPATRSNNLDALRLFGALAVILGHAYHLTGRPALVPGLLGYQIHNLGVVVFFSISGYLITASWSRSRDLVAYVSARTLRIFPALIVVVVLTVFVLGPLATTLTVGQYFDNPRSWRYLINIAMAPQYDLPGVFNDLPYPVAVNGSLWTLPAEVFCYVMVPLLCLVPRSGRALTFGAALVISLYLASVPPLESPIIWDNRLSDAAEMWVFFATGALFRLAHERWRAFFRADVAVLLALGYSLASALFPTRITDISWIALPYVVLTLGLASTPYIRRAARFGDLSYGIYLVGFPVQQIVVWKLGIVPMSVNLLLVGGISAVLALASWHVVEAPAMRLKDRLIGRGRRAAGPAVPPVDASPAPRATQDSPSQPVRPGPASSTR